MRGITPDPGCIKDGRKCNPNNSSRLQQIRTDLNFEIDCRVRQAFAEHGCMANEGCPADVDLDLDAVRLQIVLELLKELDIHPKEEP